MSEIQKGIISWAVMLVFGMSIGWISAKVYIPLVGVQIDESTGCEYMVNRNGGITPRIAADYMHMGCKGVQDNE